MVAELFTDAMRRASTGRLPAIELMGLADRLQGAGAPDLAITVYKTWIDRHPDDPMLHVAHFNHGALLSTAQDLLGARLALQEAIRLRPDFHPPYINLGLVLERLGAPAEAIAAWSQIAGQLQGVNADSIAHKKAALRQLARIMESAAFDPNAEITLRQSLELDPHQRDVLQHWLSLRQRQCEWPVISPWGELSRARLLQGMSPLTLAAYTDDPLLQLANAERCSRLDIPRPEICFAATHQALLDSPEKAAIRIGYLSSDLRDHAVGLLMAEVTELHDPTVVEVFIYYSGPAVSDPLHQRYRAANPNWRDITALTDEEAARTIVSDRIAILVDVNGHTHGARGSLLAMRPAPVIVNWLGYPGTMGSAHHHYIIADEFLIPQTHEIYFSETVVRLPCYQPNDRRRQVSQETPSRSDENLPPEAMVYCCFNGAQKFTPFTWSRWMHILRETAGSVLWLLKGVETTNDRLRRAAQSHGISPDRLIFAGRKSNPDHLARYKLADLFLDTTPYGAHTTSSDALWMGVPVLTLAGRSFASRVSGSLVTAAGISEMVCTDGEAYVARAIELGRDRTKLLAIRHSLQTQRDTCRLFNTPLLVRSLEELYSVMWRAARAGHRPRPDLSNLDVYLDIGAALDRDDGEIGSEPDYHAKYVEKLLARDEVCFLRGDARLWHSGPTSPVASLVKDNSTPQTRGVESGSSASHSNMSA